MSVNHVDFETRMVWIKKLSREELELKYELCLERLQNLEDEAQVTDRELADSRKAIVLIGEGLGVLTTMAMVARTDEHETLFKDYAPFNNIMAQYFPKPKRVRVVK
jgi:hypothetical protein